VFTLFVDTLPGAACILSEPTKYGSLSLVPYTGSTPSFIGQWGNKPWWAVGDYTIKATCSLKGHSPVSAQKAVHIDENSGGNN
jgi:hypothetical protein